MKRWFIPAAARARGQSNDLNREILASNLFNCHKEVINAPPVPSISRCFHIVYRYKNVWEYQWSNFNYNCMSTFLHYVRCKDALLDCSAPGDERCESLTWVDEISMLWHRQAIFESKGDKLPSSAECRIRTKRVSGTESPADWMSADKPTELSRIKLKTWTRQPVPMIRMPFDSRFLQKDFTLDFYIRIYHNYQPGRRNFVWLDANLMRN